MKTKQNFKSLNFQRIFSKKEELLKIKEQYREVSGGVTERTRILNKLTEELDQIKRELDEKGSSMTDGSKLFYFSKKEYFSFDSYKL